MNDSISASLGVGPVEENLALISEWPQYLLFKIHRGNLA